MKTTLTPEQSQRLIELGVDPSKASATIVTDEYNESTDNFQHLVFTLDDLLELLPKEITREFENVEIVRFQLYMNIYKGDWNVGYGENEKQRAQNNLFDDNPLLNLWWVLHPELIDALFEQLCWLLKTTLKISNNNDLHPQSQEAPQGRHGRE